MYPLHDNDLDRLSREAAEHFEVEPGASGWADLEKRLDEELPQKKKRRRFLFWLFLITATTGGALTAILTYKPVTPLGKNTAGTVVATKPSAAQQPDQANTPMNEALKNEPTATGSKPALVTPAQTATNPNNPDSYRDGQDGGPVTSSSALVPSNSRGADQSPDATVLSATPDKNTAQPVSKAGTTKKSKSTTKTDADKTSLTLNYATITPGTRGSNSWHTAKPTRNKAGKQQRITGSKDKQAVIADANNTTNTTTLDRGITTNDQQPITQPVEKNNDASTAMQPTAAATDSSGKNNTVVPPVTDSAKTLTTDTKKKEDDRKNNKKVKGLELGLIAGPDISTVEFGPMYKTGYIFGLQVGYRFSNRWSVNTGILYTKKFYKTDSQYFDYKLPWGYDLDKVEGNCSMWEIPVNLRYDVSFNDKRRWFVSTGLSTYLMDKEYYDIYYSKNGVPYPSYPLDSDTNSNYFFSIWNLSLGMERSLGKRFSIQAEPYLKVPLKGLGTGSIRMDSYGIFFTLKYKPGLQTKRSSK